MWGVRPRRPVRAHITGAQHRTQGALKELIMTRMEGVNLEHYHNKPNLKIGMTGQRFDSLRKFQAVGLNIDQ